MSTHGSELGMLEDKVAAVEYLRTGRMNENDDYMVVAAGSRISTRSNSISS